jgi:hypothetical protein
MSEQKTRILTIEVEALQPEANWIWDAHMKQPQFVNGVRVRMIADGSLQKELDELRAEHADAIERMDDDGYF